MTLDTGDGYSVRLAGHSVVEGLRAGGLVIDVDLMDGTGKLIGPLRFLHSGGVWWCPRASSGDWQTVKAGEPLWNALESFRGFVEFGHLEAVTGGGS